MQSAKVTTSPNPNTPPNFWKQFNYSLMHPYHQIFPHSKFFGVWSLLIYMGVYFITIVDMISHTFLGTVQWILIHLISLSPHQVHHILTRPKTVTYINQTLIWPNLVIILLLTPTIILLVMILNYFASHGQIHPLKVLNQFMQRLNLANIINVVALILMECHLSLLGLVIVLCFTFPWNLVAVITTLTHNNQIYRNWFTPVLIIGMVGSFALQIGLFQISSHLMQKAENKIKIENELKTPQGRFDNNIVTTPPQQSPQHPHPKVTPKHRQTTPHQDDA